MILFDARWIGPHGIGRFTKELLKKLPQVRQLNAKLPPLHPLNPLYLSWLIQQLKPSVFFTPGFNPPLYSSAPFVFTIHDLNHIQFSSASTSKQLYYKWILKPASYRAYKVLTGSEFSRSSIINWSGLSEDKVVNVGYGVSEEFCPQGEKYSPGYPYIFWIGNNKPHKNLSRLIDAFKNSKTRKNIKLLLAGEPDESAKKLVQKNNLSRDVVFAGSIAEDKIPTYYRGAEFFVFPSLYEGFGLPVLEAMACGRPVITSNCTALPEAAGDACILVNPRQKDEITDAIDNLAADLSLCRNLQAKGIIQARKFSWNQTAFKVQKILEEASQI